MAQLMRVVCYARVSTDPQSLEPQVEELKNYCSYRSFEIIRIYEDKSSGKTIERENFKKMLKDLEKNTYQVEALVITRLDRMGRNLRDLINIVESLEKWKINLICINESLDTHTDVGKLLFSILAALGEYERKLILERTAVGRKYSLEHGGRCGRKPVKLPMEEIFKKWKAGVSIRRLSRDYRVAPKTIKVNLKKYQVDLR